ncbi:MAG: 6-phosphogluconolactonase [Novosphingobium sp.]|nr:6-phosphogluconolactonase [Novosphingobium sp.]
MADLTIITGADDTAIASWIGERLEAALTLEPAGIAIAVPGGSTPFPILAKLAHAPLAWDRVVVWPGDERCVPDGHPASNAGRIRGLLEPAGAMVMPLTEDARPPHFALTWLGMGADGHVASLFPSSDPCADDPLPVRRIRPEPLPADAPFERLSLTIPALLETDAVLFVIRGADRRALFEAAAEGANDLPVARLLAAARMPVTCFS